MEKSAPILMSAKWDYTPVGSTPGVKTVRGDSIVSAILDSWEIVINAQVCLIDCNQCN